MVLITIQHILGFSLLPHLCTGGLLSSLPSPPYPAPPSALLTGAETTLSLPFSGGNGFLPRRQLLLYPSQIGIVGPADKIVLVFLFSRLHTRWKNLWSLIKMVVGCTVVFIFFNCFVLYGILL